MPRFSVSESWGAAYFSYTQSSDSVPLAICCITRNQNKDVGQIYINVKKYYLLLLKLYLFSDKNLIIYISYLVSLLL